MLTNLRINNFRGLKGLEINPLGRVNLLAGKNGAGKTSVLEALWIFSAPDMPDLTVRAAGLRGIYPTSAETIFIDIFNEFQRKHTIEISANAKARSKPRELRIYLEERSLSVARPSPSFNQSTDELGQSTQPPTEGQLQIVLDYVHEDGKKFTSRAWWEPRPITPVERVPGAMAFPSPSVVQEVQHIPSRNGCAFMSAPHREDDFVDVQRFGSLQLRGRDREILTALRTIEPKLKSIVPIVVKNSPVIYADIGMGEPVAARLLGGGFSRMFSIAVAMGSVRGGMLLIDEIENGLHHSVLGNVFSNLLSMAKRFDVQVVATTHSAECIDAAFQAVGRGSEEDFTYHRLDQLESGARAHHFDREMLETATELAMEIR